MSPRLYGLLLMLLLLAAGTTHAAPHPQAAPAFNLPDTGQPFCYNTEGTATPCPSTDAALFGQDANYQRAQPTYRDHGDGTVTDMVTGLMWQQTPVKNLTLEAALAYATSVTTGGYTDWRVPTIKELYSLMNFTGVSGGDTGVIPYLDTSVFVFEYGDTASGARLIDAQYWSSTRYVGRVMDGAVAAFGVNFADGRIKGYPIDKGNFVRYVRGGDGAYGVNAFVDNGDGTISDTATGLTWLQGDSGSFGVGSQGAGLVDWPSALAWCEGLSFAEADDWRVPDAIELQSIVDYTRSPATTQSAAIDPLFAATPITDEGGNLNYAFYWSSTTHLDGNHPGDSAVYVAFGEALGLMEMPPNSGNRRLLDVHGAGAQRSDPKTGDPADHPMGEGPQGDVRRIYNEVRCVRGGTWALFTGGTPIQPPSTGQGQPPSNGQGQPPNSGQGQPPAEAMNACQGLSQGAACSFTTPQGSISGTCNQTPEGVLACVPAGGPPPPRN